MLAASFIIFLTTFPLNHGKLLPEEPPQDDQLLVCINNIIEKFFSHIKVLTYVNMDFDNQEVIKAINAMPKAVITQTPIIFISPLDESYLIAAKDVQRFSDGLEIVARMSSWNPIVRTLVVITNFSDNDLPVLFDLLLKYHITNVLVMKEISDPNMYSYNPYENNGCGSRYDRIVDYGICSKSHHHDLYPNKIVTGLRDCTLKIRLSYLPPLVIHPVEVKRTKLCGLEEYLIKMISKLEKVKPMISYTDDAQSFSTITKDMTAVGPLQFLQNGSVDIIAGGMILTAQRAMLFSYTQPSVDHLKIIVKKAAAVSFWHNFHLEFSVVVWSALLFVFVVYLLVFFAIVRPEDKGKILLNLLASLLVNSSKIRGNCLAKYLLILWVWFAYLVNTFYQSGLVSLLNNPATDYQVSNRNDLVKYDMILCVDNVILNLLPSRKHIFAKRHKRGCNNVMRNIEKVSESSNLFTIVQDKIFRYHEYNYYDETGKNPLYVFKQPLSDLFYTMYFYKGFPITDRFNTRRMQLIENGMVANRMRWLFWRNIKKYRFVEQKRCMTIVIPWYLLVCGYLFSTIIFVLELVISFLKARSKIAK